MEADLLSYRYQLAGVMETQCLTPAPVPVRIVFPSETVYHVEGRADRLVCETPERPALATMARTVFPRSGVTVWHVFLTPAVGSGNQGFSEFDLIKLIHLYDGRMESTDLRNVVEFRVGGRGNGVKVGDLPHEICPQAPKGLTPKAGTVQIQTADGGAVAVKNGVPCPGLRSLDELLEWVSNQRGGGATDAGRPALPEPNDDEGRVLLACCGIATGIFDFDEDHMDREEALDTLQPSVTGLEVFIKALRCTVLHVSEEDRPANACPGMRGVSPYLVIPQAVLLHNETMVDCAEKAIARLDGMERPRTSELAKVRNEIEDHLAALLPNVFNYPTERSLFAVAKGIRGDDDKTESVARRLEKVQSEVDVGFAADQQAALVMVGFLGAFIAVLQILLLDDIRKAMERALHWVAPDIGIGAFGSVIAVVAVALLLASVAGLLLLRRVPHRRTKNPRRGSPT